MRFICLEFHEKLDRIEKLQHLNIRLSREILARLAPVATGFTIAQKGDPSMPLVPLDPGQNPQFTATPQPDGSSLFGAIPTWSVSGDPNVSIAAVDPTGLVATVAIGTSAVVGASIVLSVQASFTDGNGNAQSISGTLTFTIGAPPPVAATGFAITQTA